MGSEMNCNSFDSLIIPYLSDKLDEEKTELFEMHYFTCESCFENLKIAQHLNSGRVPIRPELRQRAFVFRPIFALSSLMLAFVFSMMFFFIGNNGASIYYEISKFSPPNFIKTETRGNYNEAVFDKGMEYYNAGDYSSALEKLTRISSKQNINYKVFFFKGISNLLTDNLEEAIDDFSIIIQNMNPAYFDEAIYYKGITLLRMNKKKEAISTLKNLSTDKYSPLSNKAINLISKIEAL